MTAKLSYTLPEKHLRLLRLVFFCVGLPTAVALLLASFFLAYHSNSYAPYFVLSGLMLMQQVMVAASIVPSIMDQIIGLVGRIVGNVE